MFFKLFLDFRFLIATVFHVPFLSWLGCNYSTQNCCTGSSGLDFRSQLHQVTMVTLSRTSFHLTDSIWFSTEWIYCFTSHISSHSSVPKQINNLERWIWATWGQRRGWRKRFKIWRRKKHYDRKYLEDICTLKRSSDKIVVFYFFQVTVCLVDTQNFRVRWRPLHVFCKYLCKYWSYLIKKIFGILFWELSIM